MKKVCIDGNNAAAHVAYALSEVSAIYPITPSSAMAELVDEWQNQDKKNIFGQNVKVIEMQSEAGASGTVHGSLSAGALTTTFTASQGLLLMIPNMFKIAGEFLPAVFHVSARALSTHALSIFGDHSDVMATRSTGFAMLASSSVQEAMDLALVSHIAAISTSLPFIHFFDGFRTSHEIQKIEEISYDDIKKIVPYDKLDEFRNKALNPSNPHQIGTAQNPDIYFQNREASNNDYASLPNAVVEAMNKVESITGRHYAPFEYVGSKNAKYVTVMMGSGCETCEETINFLNQDKDIYGLVKVHLYRPFDAKLFCDQIPKSAEKICVLDRTKEAGSVGEPLYLDVCASIFEMGRTNLKVIGGRYGLGGKDFSPKHVKAICDNLRTSESKNHFTVGIDDDVSFLSLKTDDNFSISNSTTKEFKFFGLGSDGTVSANKNTIKIIGNETDKYVQGYFEYDSKKSGSLTISHLRISKDPIKSAYTLNSADFIACHNYSFISRYDILKGLKQNGTVLLNTCLTEEELADNLPNNFKKTITEKSAKLYFINAAQIASACGLKNKINVIMQAAFFKISDVIDFATAEKELKAAIVKTYGKKGDAVINANISAVDSAITDIKELNVKLLKIKDEEIANVVENEYYQNFIKPIESLEGNSLKVSAFNKCGIVPTDTAKFEKRGISEACPVWQSENCIQCGKCIMACPHAAIRAVLTDKDEKLPDNFKTIPALGIKDKNYRIQISPLDCTGCNVCANVCPARNKALKMTLTTNELDKQKENFLFAESFENKQTVFSKETVKGLQFEKPYFEFSGACAGCGETPYIKALTQLFGDQMIIANATGCSSIYGGSAPSCPYAKNSAGNGPAWASSLFEDNAEFGLGIALAVADKKEKISLLCEKAICDNTFSKETNDMLTMFLANKNKLTNEQAKEISLQIQKENDCQFKKELLSLSDYFAKKSIWIIGGDGWAYDIGYGGLDHLLYQNVDINILVLDTEVYSNTGGQASKSTQTSSVAKFASGGKKSKKKDLGLLAVASNNAYVAEVSLGADMSQTIKAFVEAEKFDGPSLIIAYAPCINHGINLANSEEEMKRAVISGYKNLYRFNPRNDKPLEIDSFDPTLEYKDFLMGENRYASLKKINPCQAEKLFEESKTASMERLQNLKKFQ